MCDYSLHQVMSRPARVGEKLVSTRFTHSATHGFSVVGEPNVAICLLPGTEVAFEKEVEFDQGWSFFHKQKAAGTVARFRQVNMDKPNAHHDALEFADGRIVLVHALREGQYASVLQLPAAQHAPTEASSEFSLSAGEARMAGVVR
jgi:hypothetical protein